MEKPKTIEEEIIEKYSENVCFGIHDLKNDKINFDIIKINDLKIDLRDIILDVTHGYINGGLNLNELIFMKYYEYLGYYVERLPFSKNKPHDFYGAFRYAGFIDTDCLYKIGVPDFIVSKPRNLKDSEEPKEVFFVEGKDIYDNLNQNQITWQNTWKYPIKVIRFAPFFNPQTGNNLNYDEQLKIYLENANSRIKSLNKARKLAEL